MWIDLRSDTVTKPTPGMLEAMFKAEVGDDVWGEDPSVNALEEKTAKLFGHEAGVFCPSGTMTNQAAIRVHTRPGDEVICDVTSHIYHYEGGGIASNSGAQAKLLQGDRGRISPQQIEENINANYDWLTHTRLVSLENTGNKAGGSYYSFEQMRAISETCRRHELKLHLDGARIFNALVETGDAPNKVGPLFDSISICLSKGLGTPAGSVLVGSKAFIKQARRMRKVMGGGMRQAGFLAAAGIYALDHHVARLKDDHGRAKKLGDLVASLPYVKGLLPVDTNIVIFTLHDRVPAETFLQRLAEQQIKTTIFGKQTIRFVTHLDFTDEMLQRTCDVLKQF